MNFFSLFSLYACCCIGLLLTSRENLSTAAPLQKYLLGIMVTCSILILPAVNLILDSLTLDCLLLVAFSFRNSTSVCVVSLLFLWCLLWTEPPFYCFCFRCWFCESSLLAHPHSSSSRCSRFLITFSMPCGTPNRRSVRVQYLHSEPVWSSPPRERPKRCRNHSGTRSELKHL